MTPPGSQGTQLLRVWDRCVVASSHVILGVSEHLGVGLPLGVVRVGTEPVPQFCSKREFYKGIEPEQHC